MKHKKRSILLRSMLAAALAVGGFLADGNLRIETNVYEFAFAALPAGFDGFRIVQLSDLHGAVFGRDNERLLKAVREARPDIIALTGDLADSGTDLAEIDTLLAGLEPIAPVYYVSGNHEWSDHMLAPLQTLFHRYGVRYLRNESVELAREDGSIILAGVEDPNGWADQPTPEQVAETLPADKVRILLAHRNYWVWKYPRLPVDLILCGHIHGGVIRLPGVGGVLDHHLSLFPDYDAGVYESGTYRMLVSRGLGISGPVPRVFNHPEVAVAVLRTSDP